MKKNTILAVLVAGVAAANVFAQNGLENPFADSPAEINLDFSKERGKFSKYLFTTVDAPYPLEEGTRLAKEAGFKVVGIISLLAKNAQIEKKVELFAKYGLEGMVYYESEAEKYLPPKEVRKSADRLLSTIDRLEKRYPPFKVKAVLFGNEPDIPLKVPLTPGGKPQNPHWGGTQKQFLENYKTFVEHVKAKNPRLIVGMPGFAPECFFPPDRKGSWMSPFIEYLSKHKIPVDFLTFHSYSPEIKLGVIEPMLYIKGLLKKYPLYSPVWGEPKLSINEFDIGATPPQVQGYLKELDTAWRAAHSVLSALAMTDMGIWHMSNEVGPFVRRGDPDIDFLWIKPDGRIKPIYYGWKAFNQLYDIIQIEQQGSNFQTFGVGAGKSANNDAVTIVLSNYDEYALRQEYPSGFMLRQAREIKPYKKYKIFLKNLPWNGKDRLIFERYSVDDGHNYDLIEESELKGAAQMTIERDLALPQVQVIKIYKTADLRK